jgi:hypothetical protein
MMMNTILAPYQFAFYLAAIKECAVFYLLGFVFRNVFFHFRITFFFRFPVRGGSSFSVDTVCSTTASDIFIIPVHTNGIEQPLIVGSLILGRQNLQNGQSPTPPFSRHLTIIVCSPSAPLYCTIHMNQAEQSYVCKIHLLRFWI